VNERPVRLPDLLAEDAVIEFGQWLVEDGARVLSGERIAEVLTAGVLLYVDAPAEGTLVRSNIHTGTRLARDAIVGLILIDGEELGNA
jgi:pyruvate/2-oxoglutarate dehydrogenase complex dihydrolipoamide acyltransferase (E2) component